MKRVIHREDIDREHAAGRRAVSAPTGQCIVTPEAWSRARELGLTIDTASSSTTTATTATMTTTSTPKKAPLPPPPTDPGAAERQVDRSGIVVVRGDSVRLGRFTAAGPGKNIGLTDLVTAKDGAPMTAGLMSWHAEDSFSWSLDYDEVDYVVDGELHVVIDGRTLKAGVGDVVYLPKGSTIVFGTPSRVKVFYVTYPADWAAAANAPARPQR
jgi:ethanolamine utilization protein EutQ